MIREAFGLIYACEEIPELGELVNVRSACALPVAGRYRIIDFILSDMVNSGIKNVGIIANRKYNSLIDHLGSGKHWDLSRKSDGLFMLTPFSEADTGGDYLGMLDALKTAMSYIRRAKQEYCILSGSYTIYNRTFDDMMKFHVESGADITILYNKAENERWHGKRASELRIQIDDMSRITKVEIDPENSSVPNIGLDTYILKKDLLIRIIEDAIEHNYTYFRENAIRDNLKQLRIMAFEHKNYVARAHSVAAYFAMNMDFLDPDIRSSIFGGSNRILTKIKDGVPAKYHIGAHVKNSLVANGCVIEGNIENSVLFRGVYVGAGANIKNCIILPNTDVADNADISCTILDKNVSIRRGTQLSGSAEAPVVIKKGRSV